MSAANRGATPKAPLKANAATRSSSGGEAEAHSVAPTFPSQGRTRWVQSGRTPHAVQEVCSVDLVFRGAVQAARRGHGRSCVRPRWLGDLVTSCVVVTSRTHAKAQMHGEGLDGPVTVAACRPASARRSGPSYLPR